MLTRLLEYQPEPKEVPEIINIYIIKPNQNLYYKNSIKYALPDDPANAIEVKRCLPRYIIGEQAGQRHTNNNSSVGSAKGEGGQSRTF